MLDYCESKLLLFAFVLRQKFYKVLKFDKNFIFNYFWNFILDFIPKNIQHAFGYENSVSVLFPRHCLCLFTCPDSFVLLINNFKQMNSSYKSSAEFQFDIQIN